MDVNEREREKEIERERESKSNSGIENEESNNSSSNRAHKKKHTQKMYQLIKSVENDSPSPPTLAAISSHAQSVKYLFLKNGVALL